MQRNRISRVGFILVGALLAGAASGCLDALPDDTAAVEQAVTLAENFEAGTKASYAIADVVLDSGTWSFDEALVGTSTTDVKNGAKSGRIRNAGKISLRFDRSTGAGSVTVRHASFGSDAAGTWGLYRSTNGGTSWTQVGATQTTAAGALATATFTVNLAGAIRFEIRKLDGGSNRINVDDIVITDFGGGGGTAGGTLSVHTKMGIPSATSATDPNSFLSVKSGYVLSYNSSRKVPNWVSWEITPAYLGDTDRRDDFRPDDTFPATLPQASLADYAGSGYDRGHMCPSADRTLTIASNSQTFYLSNMVPQAANNNRGPWADLEGYSRDLVEAGKQLYVISGGTFTSSSLTIGNGVRVPDKTFKVIVVLDTLGAGPTAVTTATRVIGILMPNANSQISASADWRTFRVSVDSIEAATGYDFLSDVPAQIQAVVEAQIDNL